MLPFVTLCKLCLKFNQQEENGRDLYHTYSDTGERLYQRRRSSVSQKPYSTIQKFSTLEPVLNQPQYPVQLAVSHETSDEHDDHLHYNDISRGQDLNRRTPLPDILNGYPKDDQNNETQSMVEMDGSNETNCSNENVIHENKTVPEPKATDENVARENSLFGLTSVKLTEKENMTEIQESEQESSSFHDLNVSPVPTPKVRTFKPF